MHRTGGSKGADVFTSKFFKNQLLCSEVLSRQAAVSKRLSSSSFSALKFFPRVTLVFKNEDNPDFLGQVANMTNFEKFSQNQ